MKVCTATLKSVSPYSQSRQHDTPKLEKESSADYDERTWREHCHSDKNGVVFIPGSAFKMAVDEAAAFLSMKIPEKGKQTYTKHFLAGVLVLDNVPLGIRREDLDSVVISANPQGRRHGNSRVKRRYPIIPDWKADVTFHIADDTIGKEVFERTVAEAGKYIGIGRFRPKNGGFNGRFEVVKVQWA